MQKQNNSAKITSLAIILSLLITPVFYAEKAFAQANNSGTTVGTGSTVGTGTDVLTGTGMLLGGGTMNFGKVSGDILPMIGKLPSCKALISDGVTEIGRLFYSNASNTYRDISRIASSGKFGEAGDNAISKVADDNSLEQSSIAVYDGGARDMLKEMLKKQRDMDKLQIRDSASGCFNGVAKLVANKMIKEMTLSTVEWIRTGNGGAPYFLQNPDKFFADIAKNEILTFSAEISDSSQYPYGKDFLRNYVSAYNQHFNDNARYSLNEMIAKTTPQYNAASFYQDFSQGGWNAWDAMTQVPANNPLGFQMMASEELSKRLAGTSQSNAQNMRDALVQGNGFLGDKKCVDPKTGRLNGITQEQDAYARNAKALAAESDAKAGQAYDAWVAGGKKGLAPSQGAGNSQYLYEICEEWRYVTPGQVIADMATQGVKDSKNSIVDIQTLNDAIGAILDATLARFSNELTQKGLAGMDTNPNNYTYSNGGSNYSSSQGDYSTAQINDSTWLQQNPDFDIRSNLDQALIDTQRTYIDKLNSENAALYDLIKQIRQLDYCIPGPNPNWETTSRDSMESVFAGKVPEIGLTDLEKVNKIVNGGVGGLAQSTIQNEISKSIVGNGKNKLNNILGNIPVIPILGSLIDLLSEHDAYVQNLRGISNYMSSILKVHIGGANADPTNSKTGPWNPMGETSGTAVSGGTGLQEDVTNIGEAQDFIRNVFDTYKMSIKNMYFASNDDSDKYMPQVTFEARAEFQKIDGYQQIILDNGETITKVKSVINKLQNIKDEVDALNEQLSANVITQDDYEAQLKPIISSFARMSSAIYTGDDIAQVDNMYRQAGEENAYVKDTLLYGKYGCEKDLEKLWKTNKQLYSKYVRRQPYPFPIDHLYLPYVVANAFNKNPYEKANYLLWNFNTINSITNGPMSIAPSPTLPLNSGKPSVNNGSEGFLYGAIYTSDMLGYISGTTQQGPFATTMASCPELAKNGYWGPEGLDPNSEIRTDHINGFWTLGQMQSGGKEIYSYFPENINECGVVTRGFERIFDVY